MKVEKVKYASWHLMEIYVGSLLKFPRMSAFLLGGVSGVPFVMGGKVSLLLFFLGSYIFLTKILILPSYSRLRVSVRILCFFMGFYGATLYWMQNSLFLDIEKFFWLVPLALVGVPLLLAGVPFFLSVLCPLHRYSYFRRIIFFGVSWFLSEIIHMVEFTGFPWALTGYLYVPFLPLMQLASILSVYGVSFLVISTAVIFALIPELQTKKNGRLLFFSLLCVYSILYTFGSFRIDAIRALPNDKKITLRLVQPNHRVSLSQNMAQKEQDFIKTLTQSVSTSLKGVDIVIWPENGVPFPLNYFRKAEAKISSTLNEGQFLVTGSDFVLRNPLRLWNGLYLLNSSGTQDVYLKNHLVAFGEYVLFPKFWNAITFGHAKKITAGSVDYSKGKGLRNISMNLKGQEISLAPLICFEAIFPGNVISRQEKRPNFLLNITNDGWYDGTPGPAQHFNIALVRAIEEGMPLIRVANSGVSGVVNAAGEIIASLPPETPGILDVDLPPFLEGTFFSRNLSTYFNHYKSFFVS